MFVLDLYDPQNRFVVVRASSFDEALREKPKAPTSADVAANDSPLDRVVSSCSGNGTGLALDLTQPAEREHPVAKLQTCMECLKAFEEKRFVTNRNDNVLLIVLFNGAVVKREDIRPFFEEVKRQSELIATGKALFELLRAEATPRLSCASFAYTLQNKRSNLSVTVPLPKGAVPRGKSSAAAKADAPPANPLKVATPEFDTQTAQSGEPAEPAVAKSPSVVLGPVERWFMSADFSFDKASVALGEQPAPDAEALTTKNLFVALNFSFGDLLADRDAPLQRRNVFRELLIKVQATPSTEPWEAWAVGLGLRGYRIKTILWNMDVAHPYVTFGRQSIDGAEPKWRAAFGIGFDPRSINRED